MKIDDLSIRRVAPEEMADNREAIGCFVTTDDGQSHYCTLPVDRIQNKEPDEIANILRFFAAVIGRMGKPDDDAEAA